MRSRAVLVVIEVADFPDVVDVRGLVRSLALAGHGARALRAMTSELASESASAAVLDAAATMPSIGGVA